MRKDYKHSEEVKEKIRKNANPWNKGLVGVQVCWAKGKAGTYHHSKEANELKRERSIKENIGSRLPHNFGELHHRWKGGYQNTLVLNHNYRARKIGAIGTHTLKEWEEVKETYLNRCASCKKEKPLTEDHIVPLSKGGSNLIENIQPLCLNCNSRKGTRLISFIAEQAV